MSFFRHRIRDMGILTAADMKIMSMKMGPPSLLLEAHHIPTSGNTPNRVSGQTQTILRSLSFWRIFSRTLSKTFSVAEFLKPS